MQGFNAAVSVPVPVPVPQPLAVTNSNPSYCLMHSPLCFRVEDSGTNTARLADLGELEKSVGHGFHHNDGGANFNRSYYNDMNATNNSVASSNLQFGGFNSSSGSVEMVASGIAVMDSGQVMLQKGTMVSGGVSFGPFGSGPFENLADSGLGSQTDVLTDTDDINQYTGVQNESLITADVAEQGKIGDRKALRRLAQNREAAKKSRMRKRVYVQELENSRLRLTQLEQEVKKARTQEFTSHPQTNSNAHMGSSLQGISVTSRFSADQSRYVGRNGALGFDIEYEQWVDEHQHLISDLRSAVSCQAGDSKLKLLVDRVMSHYDEIFLLKSIGVKSDVFHILTGMWKTPAERCFIWLGGFRCSEMLKVLESQIEPLTEQQVLGICTLKQSSQQAEDALTQGMEALQQSLVDSLSFHSVATHRPGNVTNYMGQMMIAMNNLATLGSFIRQADLLRQKTLQQLQRILTAHQTASALIAISDYRTRLRTLSTLWMACPKE